MTPHISGTKRIASVGIGVFILWELFFLPASNIIDFIPRRLPAQDLNPNFDYLQEHGVFTDIEPIQRSAEVVGHVLDFWSEVSGQDQGWKLFTPGLPPHSFFSAVELKFADGSSALIRSEYEPTDTAHPTPRIPLIHNRAYNFETQLVVIGWFCGEESLALMPEQWRIELPNSVRADRKVIVAFLNWKARRYMAEHPEQGEPVEVVLLFRYIPTPDPTDPSRTRGPTVTRPYCRWLPATNTLEPFDPVAKKYIPLTEASR